MNDKQGVAITVFEYNDKAINERKTVDFDGLNNENTGMVKWINIDGLHDKAVFEKLASVFHLHPLVIEDMLNAKQRPKIADYGDYIYIVIKVLNLSESGVKAGHQNVILGNNFVISAGEKSKNPFKTVEERLRTGARVRKMGADYLAYLLLDTIVDGYFDLLEKLGDRIERVENLVLSKPGNDSLRTINNIKRDMLYIHKSLWPLREIAGTLERGDSQLLQESLRLYTRDLYDHVTQIMDTSEIYREVLSGMLDIYLSSLSNRMNEIMKVLTIISTLFIPLSFITGVYGMNFKVIPELNWSWGYPAVMLLMAGIAVSMLVFFKRRKWL